MKEQIKLLVEYQELDKKLKAIDDDILNTDVAKKYYHAGKFLKSVTDSLNKIDEKAQTLLSRYNEAVKRVKELNDIASEHLVAIDECKDETELTYISKKYKERTAELSAKEAELDGIIKEMEAVRKEFEKLGSDRRKMKEQFEENKPKFDILKNEKSKEKDEIKAKQDKLEKNIDKELIARYNAKRKDKKFPIVFAVRIDGKSTHCPYCGSSLSITLVDELLNNKLCDCDSCRSMIYGEAD